MIVVSSFLSGFSSLPFYLCVWMCAFIRDSFSDRLNFATLNLVSQMQCCRTRLVGSRNFISTSIEGSVGTYLLVIPGSVSQHI